MKEPLKLLKGASAHLEPGYKLFRPKSRRMLRPEDRIYVVTDVDRDSDEVWGVWDPNIPTDRWWLLNTSNEHPNDPM